MRAVIAAALLIGAGALLHPSNNFIKVETDETEKKDAVEASSSLMKMLVTHGCLAREPEEWAAFKPPPFPEALKNRNLVVFGDSVDRCASRHLCAMYGAPAEAPWANGQQLTFNADTHVQNPHHVCHFQQFNTTLLYRAHAGAMSTKNEHNWHQQGRIDQHACWHAWGDQRDYMPGGALSQTPYLGKPLFGVEPPLHCQVEPVWELNEHYVLKNMMDSLPQRPNILVVQSSLWDSTFAGKVLETNGKPYNFNQQGLPVQGWKENTDGIAAWDWDQKAGELLQMTRNNGVQYEKTLWRTNSNCPAGQYGELKDFENWVNWCSEEMANVAREKVKSQDGPWAGVTLMDWRAALDARSQNLCDGIHYTVPGYDNFVQTLFKTIDTAYQPDHP